MCARLLYGCTRSRLVNVVVKNEVWFNLMCNPRPRESVAARNDEGHALEEWNKKFDAILFSVRGLFGRDGGVTCDVGVEVGGDVDVGNVCVHELWSTREGDNRIPLLHLMRRVGVCSYHVIRTTKYGRILPTALVFFLCVYQSKKDERNVTIMRLTQKSKRHTSTHTHTHIIHTYTPL